MFDCNASRYGCATLLGAALLTLPACSTNITVDSAIHLSAGGNATLRFQPVPPVGTINVRNTGPDRARLEFFGPSPDHPAMLDRMLTVELGVNGSSLQSISGVQRIEVTMLGADQTSVFYTIRSREGVGYTVDAGRGTVLTAGEKPADAAESPDANSDR